MITLLRSFCKKAWRDARGQEFLEYALLAGFLATACGAMSPAAASSVSSVFSKITSTLEHTGGSSMSSNN
jgi:Flp pilus assembly pilin Flp